MVCVVVSDLVLKLCGKVERLVYRQWQVVFTKQRGCGMNGVM
jgi:hypothetical protein